MELPPASAAPQAAAEREHARRPKQSEAGGLGHDRDERDALARGEGAVAFKTDDQQILTRRTQRRGNELEPLGPQRRVGTGVNAKVVDKRRVERISDVEHEDAAGPLHPDEGELAAVDFADHQTFRLRSLVVAAAVNKAGGVIVADVLL